MPPSIQNVHTFVGDHPEFSLWRQEEPYDPGRLHFNHQVHLQPGGVFGPDGEPARLNCASCHEPDEQRRYLKPINYERHCARCHVLAVQVLGNWGDEPIRAAAEQFRAQPAPHRAPAEVRAALRDRLTQFVQEHPAVLGPAAARPLARPIPGPQPGSTAPIEKGTWVNDQLRQTERFLFDGPGGCRHCHERASSDAPGGLPQYERTNLLNRWLPRSQFDHDSHRMLACTECHAATESRRAADLLLPRIDNCRQCHNSRVGAPTECIDCHRYHHRDQEGDWQGKFTIDQAVGPSPVRRR
jgi:hypothetical protein